MTMIAVLVTGCFAYLTLFATIETNERGGAGDGGSSFGAAQLRSTHAPLRTASYLLRLRLMA